MAESPSVTSTPKRHQPTWLNGLVVVGMVVWAVVMTATAAWYLLQSYLSSLVQ